MERSEEAQQAGFRLAEAINDADRAIAELNDCLVAAMDAGVPTRELARRTRINRNRFNGRPTRVVDWRR